MICDHMKWTYDEYMAQPEFFVQGIFMKMIEDAKHNNEMSGTVDKTYA